MIDTRLITTTLQPLVDDTSRRSDGAELVFHGRVRDMEGNKPIVALFYEHYPVMAERELNSLAQETIERFPISSLTCWHRVGEVRVGEASLRLVVVSKHRLEALQSLSWFVNELKRRVPIWKWAVDASGHLEPCGPCTGCGKAAGPVTEETWP